MDVGMGDTDTTDPTPGVNAPEASKATHTASKPYECDPVKVPKDDPFLAKSPNYGRYLPHPDDFTPDPRYTGFGDPSNLEYWKGILAKCDETTRIRGSGAGKREAHAIGGMIIKFKPCAAETSESGTCLFDENEREAMVAASDALGEGVKIPSIYFIGRVGDVDLLVQSRIPGVTLEVAWRYLSAEQKEGFKQQTRRILQSLISISPPSSEDITEPAYIYADCANARHQRRLQQLEYDLLFMDDNSEDFGFMHNDMIPSKIIVNNDQIVGIIGWNKSGWFGWERARNVHRQVRAPEFARTDSISRGLEFENVWTDLYDIDIDRPRRTTKAEPLLPSLEKVPASTSAETEHPTPKKIADLKRGSISRASSSERSSPSTPSKPAAGANKRPNASTAKKPDKKGAASRKPAAKKRKTNTLDQDSKDATITVAHRSGTPASSRASRTPAPAPKSTVEENEVEEEGDDGEDEDDGVFCICRKPDNHTWMIGCDGGCEDWFHSTCVKIDRTDADLIDKYICPNCEEAGIGHTTWKPMCRLPSCRQPARVKPKELSKYCCDEHGREFMRLKARNLKMPESASSTPSIGGQHAREPSSATARKGRKGAQTEDSHDEAAEDEDVDMEGAETEREELENLGSRGGVLTGPDLKAAISNVSSAKEFRELGESDATPGLGEAAKDRERRQKEFWFPFKNQEDFYSKHPNFQAENENLVKRSDQINGRLALLENREKFLVLVRQRVKAVLERLRKADPKGGWKDICGYDSRLAWSDEEFEEWAKSDAGKKALEDNDLDALQVTSADGDSEMADAEDDTKNTDAIARGICTKKRCERHKQWAKVEQQNLALEKSSAEEDFRKYEDDTNDYVKKEIRKVSCKKLEAEGKTDPEPLQGSGEEVKSEQAMNGEKEGNDGEGVKGN